MTLADDHDDLDLSDFGALGAQHQSLNDLVRESLRDAILTGRFKPGDRLVEGRLASLFGVSRNPVREALKALHNEGIVTIAPRRGAIVAELSADEAAEVIELRAALEGLSARLAARRLSADHASALQRILDDGDRAVQEGRTDVLHTLNDLFHGELARTGSNRFLVDYMRTLRTKTQWLFAGIAADRAVASWHEHAAILRAVLERDEDLAALLASRHVTRVGNAMLRTAAAALPTDRALDPQD